MSRGNGVAGLLGLVLGLGAGKLGGDAQLRRRKEEQQRQDDATAYARQQDALARADRGKQSAYQAARDLAGTLAPQGAQQALALGGQYLTGQAEPDTLGIPAPGGDGVGPWQPPVHALADLAGGESRAAYDLRTAHEKTADDRAWELKLLEQQQQLAQANQAEGRVWDEAKLHANRMAYARLAEEARRTGRVPVREQAGPFQNEAERPQYLPQPLGAGPLLSDVEHERDLEKIRVSGEVRSAQAARTANIRALERIGSAQAKAVMERAKVLAGTTLPLESQIDQAMQDVGVAYGDLVSQFSAGGAPGSAGPQGARYGAHAQEREDQYLADVADRVLRSQVGGMAGPAAGIVGPALSGTRLVPGPRQEREARLAAQGPVRTPGQMKASKQAADIANAQRRAGLEERRVKAYEKAVDSDANYKTTRSLLQPHQGRLPDEVKVGLKQLESRASDANAKFETYLKKLSGQLGSRGEAWLTFDPEDETSFEGLPPEQVKVAQRFWKETKDASAAYNRAAEPYISAAMVAPGAGGTGGAGAGAGAGGSERRTITPLSGGKQLKPITVTYQELVSRYGERVANDLWNGREIRK